MSLKLSFTVVFSRSTTSLQYDEICELKDVEIYIELSLIAYQMEVSSYLNRVFKWLIAYIINNVKNSGK